MTRKLLILPVCFVLLSCDLTKEENRVLVFITVIGVVIAVLAGGSKGCTGSPDSDLDYTDFDAGVFNSTHPQTEHSHTHADSSDDSDSVLLHSGGLDRFNCHSVGGRAGTRHCHNSSSAPAC